MKYTLFEVSGVELEYMLVDSESLQIKSIADVLLTDENNEIQEDFYRGPICWSNELAAHVIELKTSKPTKNLEGCEEHFVENIKFINQKLLKHNCQLMPTAAHPFMLPLTDGELWKHSGSEIYKCYERLFNIRSHGWLNLQSVHLNLPFNGDVEFGRLHAAIRLLLPLLPLLSASSPVMEGKLTDVEDGRLREYLGHQLKLKSSMGLVIPEPCYTQKDYEQVIFKPIEEELKLLDTSGVLQSKFLNARGAIARFERGSIEIRVLDISECPKVDLAICAFIQEILKLLVFEEMLTFNEQAKIETAILRKQLDEVVSKGSLASLVNNPAYEKIIEGNSTNLAFDILQIFFERIKNNLSSNQANVIKFIFEHGNLSRRIIKRLSPAPEKSDIILVYKELQECLQENKLFL